MLYLSKISYAAYSAVFFVLLTSGAFSGQKSSDIPLKAFAQLKITSNMKLSPDGTHMAYSMVHKGREVVIIKPLGKGKAVAVPAADNAETKWFRWANKDRLVVSYAFTSKRRTVTTRETRLYGVDRDGKNFVNLIRSKRRLQAQFQDNVIDWLEDDPDHILVVLDSDLNSEDEVRRVNVKSGSYQDIIKGKRGIQNYRTDQQHKVRMAWGYQQATFINKYKSPITNKWKSIEKTSWGDKGFSLITFTEDPRIAYAGGNNEHGRRAVFKINLETEEILGPVFSHEKVDFDYIVNHPVTGKPAGVQFTLDKPETIYFDKKLQSIQMTVDRALPDTVNEIVSIQPEKKLYLIYAESDREPGVYYLLDMMSKKLNFLSETLPGIRPENMSPVKAVSYISRDDVRIPGYLTLPKGKDSKNLPAVILVHGGPHARYTQMFDYTVQFLTSRGYAVLQPNFRGSEGFGNRFENAGRHQWGGVMQDDLTDGTKWLIEQGIADPDRICIVGASYGGYAAAMGLIKTPDLFKCGISVSGVLNIPSLISSKKKYIGGKSWSKEYGLEGEDPETVSPYHRVDDINTPILIVHAKDDHIVLYKQATGIVKKLKKLKKDVTFVTMKDGDHYLDTEASRITELTAMEKFLKKHIGN